MSKNWVHTANEACQIVNPDRPDLVANEIENIVRLLARIVNGENYVSLENFNVRKEAAEMFVRMKLPAIKP